MRSFLGWLAVVAAFASAGLWFWAARVKIDAADFGGFGGATPESVAAFGKQNSLNGYAALATGVSALLQAITLTLP
jgi:hypothetical protein